VTQADSSNQQRAHPQARSDVKQVTQPFPSRGNLLIAIDDRRDRFGAAPVRARHLPFTASLDVKEITEIALEAW
jgi:hypothetical protein